MSDDRSGQHNQGQDSSWAPNPSHQDPNQPQQPAPQPTTEHLTTQHPTAAQSQYPGYQQQAYGQAPYGAYQQQDGYRPTEQYPTAPGGSTPTGPTPNAMPTAVGAPGPAKPKSGRTAIAAGAIALALVSGGIGGAVGAWSAQDGNGSGPATNALSVPKTNATQTANAPAGSVQSVAQKVLPSVVQIQVVGSRAEGEGSGVVLSSDGLILTNNHVVSGAGPDGKLTVAFSDGTTASAKMVGTDPTSDIAVIKADGKTDLTPIELGDSENLQVGQQVVAIGSPLGLAGTVTTGIVSSLNRPVSTSGESGNQNTVIDAIQTDAAINPGNSGGALVDMDGRLIGINTAIASLGGAAGGQQAGSIGLGFAIPVDQARRIADELTKTGKATQAIVGVTVSSRDASHGAGVQDVTAGGPADKAGIPKGAVITKVDDRIIDSGDALIAAIRSHAPGDKVSITYTDPNGSNPKTVEATLGAAPTQGGR
ncbi:S1C family serine protease [Rhodococcus tukisamuensis]|uniref:Putative serine protease PepD n=1 Tax=Rhodococcus tukisamuensis TaxID=168276 RepID=A0A1G6PKH1_9NOCA|nr:trypsin-like peptidase domain-containing protein [Rhodococcus tukisamuensis]SDC79897.1 putative serine protease PepD [Rhodococcus tukisamuensis]